MEKRIIIDDIETNYTLDENGKVKNLLTKQYLKGSFTRSGYHYIRISVNGEKKRFLLHRKVAELFVEGYQPGFVVNHKNGDKLDNRAENLEWVSQSDNVKHAHDTKLIKERAKTEYYENDLPDEQWVEIPDYPKYKISNMGRVVSYKQSKPIILKPSVTNGYYKIVLSKNGKTKGFLLHQLVYYAFTLDKIDTKLYCIDHIDNDAFNNKLDNLRKVTIQENTILGLKEQNTYSNMRKVAAYYEGKQIGIYCSCREAAKELNLDASAISKVCRGVYSHTHNYFFKYLDNE